jgi:hypothetical protein
MRSTLAGAWVHAARKPPGLSPRPAELDVKTVVTDGCRRSHRRASAVCSRQRAGIGAGAG